MFMSIRWVRQVRNAARNSFFSIFCLTLARTSALGLTVSRFPRGACKTTECIDGMTVTILDPRSIIRVLSSATSSDGIWKPILQLRVGRSRPSRAGQRRTIFRRVWVVRTRCVGVNAKDVHEVVRRVAVALPD